MIYVDRQTDGLCWHLSTTCSLPLAAAHTHWLPPLWNSNSIPSNPKACPNSLSLPGTNAAQVALLLPAPAYLLHKKAARVFKTSTPFVARLRAYVSETSVDINIHAYDDSDGDSSHIVARTCLQQILFEGGDRHMDGPCCLFLLL